MPGDQTPHRSAHQPVLSDEQLAVLEHAQIGYAHWIGVLADTMPFEKWLNDRPAHTVPTDYFETVGAVAGQMKRLEAAFGIHVLAARPSIVEQLQWPN
jgi:hypothetical protein